MNQERKIGFIGGGEMAWAMAVGFISGKGSLFKENKFLFSLSFFYQKLFFFCIFYRVATHSD